MMSKSKMMKIKLQELYRKSERGQATIEIIYSFAFLFFLFLLMLAVAIVWHGHHITSPISLEAASRESIQPGWGQGYVLSTGNSWDKSTTLDVSVSSNPLLNSVYAPLKAKVITVFGWVSIPWAPFDLDWNIPIQATTISPVWEFNNGGGE
ncbi:MAG: hypothetical protein P8Z41_13720 [Anaerolineales bacterium]